MCGNPELRTPNVPSGFVTTYPGLQYIQHISRPRRFPCCGSVAMHRAGRQRNDVEDWRDQPCYEKKICKYVFGRARACIRLWVK